MEDEKVGRETDPLPVEPHTEAPVETCVGGSTHLSTRPKCFQLNQHAVGCDSLWAVGIMNHANTRQFPFIVTSIRTRFGSLSVLLARRPFLVLTELFRFPADAVSIVCVLHLCNFRTTVCCLFESTRIGLL